MKNSNICEAIDDEYEKSCYYFIILAYNFFMTE